MDRVQSNTSSNSEVSRSNGSERNDSVGNDFQKTIQAAANGNAENGNVENGSIDNTHFAHSDPVKDLTNSLEVKGLSASDASSVAGEAIDQINAQGGDINDPDQLKASILDAQDTLGIQNPLSDTDLDDVVAGLTGQSPTDASFETEDTSETDGASEADGASETDGASEADGASETDGASEADGASETDGASEADGASETDGASEADGASETDGASEADGASETDGASEADQTAPTEASAAGNTGSGNALNLIEQLLQMLGFKPEEAKKMAKDISKNLKENGGDLKAAITDAAKSNGLNLGSAQVDHMVSAIQDSGVDLTNMGTGTDTLGVGKDLGTGQDLDVAA